MIVLLRFAASCLTAAITWYAAALSSPVVGSSCKRKQDADWNPSQPENMLSWKCGKVRPRIYSKLPSNEPYG